MLDLAVNGGTIVSDTKTFAANVGVRNGIIAVLSAGPLEAATTLDATGQYLFPGAIDPHVHMQPRKPGEEAKAFIEWSDDFMSGSISAAVGGVTTLMDFAVQTQEEGSSVQEVVEQYREIASETSVIDFALHAGITRAGADSLAEIPALIKAGVPTFKFYRTYKKWGIYVGLGFLREALETIRTHGGMAAVHCEQDEVISYLRDKFISQGLERDLTYHAKSRPAVAEEIAIDEVAALAREQNTRMYVVHLSSARGLEAVRRAKRESPNFFCEAGFHYFVFTEEVFSRPDAPLYFMTPPFRTEEDIEALWKGLADGSIDWLATDHSPHLRSEKLADPRFSPSEDGLEFAISPGFTGIEELLSLVHSHGVVTGKISLPRLVAVLSTNPARILGLTSKGAIEIGKDADLVIFDPEKEREITIKDLHTKADYTLYEGMKVKGSPTATISRGEIIAKDGEFIGKPGRGRFVARQLTDL